VAAPPAWLTDVVLWIRTLASHIDPADALFVLRVAVASNRTAPRLIPRGCADSGEDRARIFAEFDPEKWFEFSTDCSARLLRILSTLPYQAHDVDVPAAPWGDVASYNAHADRAIRSISQGLADNVSGPLFQAHNTVRDLLTARSTVDHVFVNVWAITGLPVHNAKMSEHLAGFTMNEVLSGGYLAAPNRDWATICAFERPTSEWRHISGEPSPGIAAWCVATAARPMTTPIVSIRLPEAASQGNVVGRPSAESRGRCAAALTPFVDSAAPTLANPANGAMFDIVASLAGYFNNNNPIPADMIGLDALIRNQADARAPHQKWAAQLLRLIHVSRLQGYHARPAGAVNQDAEALSAAWYTITSANVRALVLVPPAADAIGVVQPGPL